MADRTEIRESLEADLNKAIEQSISSSPLNGPVPANTTSRRAVDQLAQAVAGLMHVEQELAQLTEQLAGHLNEKEGRDRVPPAAEGLPMFDRVRGDATALAELAIRMHNLIEHAKNSL